ncbi:hypothetical protein D9619_006874 [Psilocybe cf. subviscida]|uniref:Uncharacterized protein n=1 Tax=Psilocybe cf. subviscida TaxID=2480587 RepID=A0A8H5B609_9AGAR|nr:hypothetical protein D9619_006874 [Psilocybe cf. subviscida]
MSVIGPPARGKVKDQYQHAIPQFILRNFESNPVTFRCTIGTSTRSFSLEINPILSPRNSRERKIVTFLARVKDGKHLDTIHYYDLNTGVLSNPPISRVYGKLNMYRDTAHNTNVDHIEQKLAGLENDAAAVMKTIHTNIHSGAFTISRLELYTLRKFLFLMHYRHDAMSTRYFQEENPTNARLTAWIRKYKQVHQLSTVVDIWRHGLAYYLDTAHQTILTRGEDIRARYGADKFHQMLAQGVDPDLEEKWFAVDYESQANSYVLGVWEAAVGSEFVLGGNAFGLWEGRIHGTPGAHKIYVMSPRIAIVLRHHVLLREATYDDPAVLTSCLSDIEIGQPDIQYFLEQKVAEIQLKNEWTVEERMKYRRSPKAQKDTFTIPITKLTEAETYAVNEIVMMNANVHLDGAITYGSPSVMLKTLERYMNAQNTFIGLKKALYRPLLQELLKMDLLSPGSSNGTFDFGTPEIHSDSETDLQLSLLLRMMVVSGGIEFTSRYSRAYLVYHMATMASSLTNPVTREIRKMVDEAIKTLSPYSVAPTNASIPTSSRMATASLPTPPSSPTHISPRKSTPSRQVVIPFNQPSSSKHTAKMTLIESLSKEDSDLFFARFGAEVDKLDVGEYTNDLLGNIVYEAAMIGIAQWMAETRPDVLSTFFKPLLKAAEVW